MNINQLAGGRAVLGHLALLWALVVPGESLQLPRGPGGMHPEAADSTCPHLIPCRHPAGDQGVPAVRDGGARGWSYHYALSDQ